LTITVLVLGVTALVGDGSAFTAGVEDALVGRTITVIIRPVADLLRLWSTHAAGVQEPLVDLAVTVVVFSIADLVFEHGVRREADDAVAPFGTDGASIEAAGPFPDKADLAQGEALVRRSVTIVIDAIAALHLAGPHHGRALHPSIGGTLCNPVSRAGTDTNGARLPHPQRLVHEGVAVIIQAVTHLVRRLGGHGAALGPHLSAADHDTTSATGTLPVETHSPEVPFFVDLVVAVVVQPITSLYEVVSTSTAAIEGALVGGPIAVIVLSIADLHDGLSRRGVAGRRVVGDACESSGAFTGTHAHIAWLTDVEVLVDAPVTVLVLAVATLGGAGVDVWIIVGTVQGRRHAVFVDVHPGLSAIRRRGGHIGVRGRTPVAGNGYVSVDERRGVQNRPVTENHLPVRGGPIAIPSLERAVFARHRIPIRRAPVSRSLIPLVIRVSFDAPDGHHKGEKSSIQPIHAWPRNIMSPIHISSSPPNGIQNADLSDEIVLRSDRGMSE